MQFAMHFFEHQYAGQAYVAFEVGLMIVISI
jgi:hypothetical protein